MNGGSESDLIDSIGEFISAWDFSSPPAVLFLLLASAYVVGSFRLGMRASAGIDFWMRFAASLAGFALLAVSLAGPLDYYSGELFTTHMSQHIVIAMLAAPLLLIARPMPAYIWALPRPLRAGVGTALSGTGRSVRVLRTVTRPAVALPLFVGTLYGWHIPGVYNTSLENEWLHLLMHFTMFSSAVLFWWPIVGPPPVRTRLTYPQRFVYLLFAVTPTALLAAVITLSNSLIFDFYLASPGHFSWSPVEDQRMGGLLMWIPGNFVYLTTMTVLFFRWFAAEERVSSLRATDRPQNARSQHPRKPSANP